MKRRQRMKILKRAGLRIRLKIPLTKLEKMVCDKVADSKLCSAIDKFRVKEFDAGTYLDDGYIDRMKEVIRKTSTIENVTGVKEIS